MTERKRLFTPTSSNANVASLFKGWKEWKDGDYIVGELHSVYATTYKGKTSNNYRIKVLDCNFTVDESKDSDKQISPVGKIFTLNPMGRVNKFMDGSKDKPKIQVGQVIDLTYEGKHKAEDGEVYHHCKIEAGWPEGKEPKESEDYSGSTDGL